MHFALEHCGVAVSATTGVLAARGKQVDLFGVIVLALVTALGGGTIRDLIMAKGPVFWMEDTRYLMNAAFTPLVVFYIVRYHELPTAVLLIADALSLAFFTIIGTQKALNYDLAPGACVMMGVTTGVAGGILRDVLLGQLPLVFRREIYLYATAAFGGAVLFVTLNKAGLEPATNLVFCTVVTLLLRLAGIRWKIALPMFRPKSETPDPSDKK
jgi:uncharacterized membrane protein YeiH